MKINELTYGSIVRIKNSGRIIRVCNITRKKIGYHIQENESYMHYTLLSDIEPVEITIDSLERNGFAYDDFNHSYIIKNQTIRDDFEGLPDYSEYVGISSLNDENKLGWWYLTIFKSDKESEFALRIEKPVKYIHELQLLLTEGNVIGQVENYKL